MSISGRTTANRVGEAQSLHDRVAGLTERDQVLHRIIPGDPPGDDVVDVWTGRQIATALTAPAIPRDGLAPSALPGGLLQARRAGGHASWALPTAGQWDPFTGRGVVAERLLTEQTGRPGLADWRGHALPRAVLADGRFGRGATVRLAAAGADQIGGVARWALPATRPWRRLSHRGVVAERPLAQRTDRLDLTDRWGDALPRAVQTGVPGAPRRCDQEAERLPACPTNSLLVLGWIRGTATTVRPARCRHNSSSIRQSETVLVERMR